MNIEENKSLKKYNTFNTESHAKYFISVDSILDIHSALTSHPWGENKFHILGGGSNTLFIKDFDGVVIYNNLKGKSIINEDSKSITIKVSSGEDWHSLVLWSVENELWGIENLALIPGTVGASAVQNIGAYGTEAKDIIVSVEYINLSNNKAGIFDNKQCEFKYRDSIFKKHPEYFITAVTFKLSKINIDEKVIKEVVEEIIRTRKNKLPDVGSIGMAGSFFKNPVVTKEHISNLLKQFPDIVYFDLPNDKIKISAGWLIEYLGYKGVTKNNVGTYEKHALIIVNHGNATGEEVWKFAQEIINSVYKTFDIKLEPEVLIV